MIVLINLIEDSLALRYIGNGKGDLLATSGAVPHGRAGSQAVVTRPRPERTGIGEVRTAAMPEPLEVEARSAPADRPLRVLVWYWGRRGGGARYTLETARALAQRPDVRVHLSLSRGNELLDDFAQLRLPGLLIDTYSDPLSAGLRCCGLPRLRREFRSYLQAHAIDAVLSTMPHLWTAAVAGVVRKAGARLVSVVHDAVTHPGEWLPLHTWRQRRELQQADAVVTLSGHVRATLHREYGYPLARIATIPHGLLRFSNLPVTPRRFPADRPFRFMFFGRILPYKGLERLLAAYAMLRAEGVTAELWIVGGGDIRPYKAQLDRLPGVTLINQWIAEEDIPQILARADLMVLPYIEASQSGVVVSAYGAGIPVIVTPVGGLIEQVEHRRTGLVAGGLTPEALRNSMLESLDRRLYNAFADNILAYGQTALCWNAQSQHLVTVLRAAAAGGP